MITLLLALATAIPPCCAPPPPRSAPRTIEVRWNYDGIIDADTSQPIPDSWRNELLDAKPGIPIEVVFRSIANTPQILRGSGYCYFDQMVDHAASDPTDWDPLVQTLNPAIAFTTTPFTVADAGWTAIVNGSGNETVWVEAAEHSYEIGWMGQLQNGNRDHDIMRLRIIFFVRQFPL